MVEWHPDSGRVNIELETDPRPRLSLKVAYFLTDVSEPGRGNFYIRARQPSEVRYERSNVRNQP